ncbi:arsenic resistance N-acetyltransferase ArsN2 [Natronomonas marina]|uniref:arsenic resistance N-acetyltransferase ArsN2 n=1 Tax=Natronomonas marina TaxID=2961939 RepID=UPI0020C98BAD|nr:arsenic resistance N-acetyltransferase ArsN2 [Natronomonas marina]
MDRTSIHPATDDELGYVESLLDAADLPTADVRSGDATFYLARRGGERVGVGGLEVHGADGLLRSLVVEESARGEGIGNALCTGLEGEAGRAGVGTLFLLTTTAAAFFAARGYERVERSAVPTAIRGTAQFGELCPATATCLRKGL